MRMTPMLDESVFPTHTGSTPPKSTLQQERPARNLGSFNQNLSFDNLDIFGPWQMTELHLTVKELSI